MVPYIAPLTPGWNCSHSLRKSILPVDGYDEIVWRCYGNAGWGTGERTKLNRNGMDKTAW
jgi:hypothetical protein